jgi:proteasome alpha subunit
MGGQAEAVLTVLRSRFQPASSLSDAMRLALDALGSVGGEGGQPRTVPANQLEVAVLDRRRTGRTFRRITGAALTALLNPPAPPAEEPAPEAAAQAEPASEEPAGSTEAAEPDTTEPGATEG